MVCGTRRAGSSCAEALVKWIPPILVERRAHARRQRATVLRAHARGITRGVACMRLALGEAAVRQLEVQRAVG